MVAGNATVTMERKCVPSSPARCLPVATPPFVPDSAAHPAQVKASCRLLHSHLQPSGAWYLPATLREERVSPQDPSQLPVASVINSHRLGRLL